MPSIRVSPRIAAWVIALVVAGCASMTLPTTSDDVARLPRDIRTGAADMVLQPVERDVSPDEVNAAVSRIVAATPVCLGWPSLWLDNVQYRTVFRARFDLMRRDWGAAVASGSEQRMSEFVDMGFLTSRPRDDIGPGVIEYTLTDLGATKLNGSPYGDRPTFCAPSERQVIAVTQMDWGQFPCGNLQVHFTHQAPPAPSWATTEAARARVAQSDDAPPQGEGVVTLSRQWFQPRELPTGMTNGSLQSVCYDRSHQNIVGNDLNLMAGP